MGRNADMKNERRRRSNNLSGSRRRRHVDESLRDREKYEYRWINDEAERIHSLTVNDDWDIVSDREKATGTGSELASQVGSGAKGSPLRAILVRKLKEYHDADKADQQRLIDAQEDALKGNVPEGADAENLYQPKTQTTISRG